MAIAYPHHSEQADKLFKAPEYKLVDNKVVKYSDVLVHKFVMGDVEDPDLYAGQPLSEWQQSDAGQWVMEHAAEVPFWHRQVDPYSFGHTYFVIARLSEQDQMYWALKWK